MASEEGKSSDREPEVTASMPAQRAAEGAEETLAEETLSREEQNRRLAAQLLKRGVSPEEVQRLLALGAQAAASVSPAAPVKSPAAPPPTLVPEEEPFVPKPTIILPPPREATEEEREQADRLLTMANLARRRGNYVEAEQRCREAVEKNPSDASALELYGDILQAIGRVDDAVLAYDRARELDPNRPSAERKYADLVLQQNRSIELLSEEYIPRNPMVAVLMSSLLPGAGQMYNGQPVKGLLIAVGMLICVFVLGWTDYGLMAGLTFISPPLVFFLLLAGAIYIYAVVDANVNARKGRRRSSGWEV
jgi:tetratricopeptide (TPR) repeat protein